MEIPGLIPYENTFDALYGLEIVEHSEDRIVGRVPVRDSVKQPMGLSCRAPDVCVGCAVAG